MRWERWRWLIAGVALAAIVVGVTGWDVLGADCGDASSPGESTRETFACDGAGYALLAAWVLGAVTLTAVVAAEFLRRLRGGD